MSKKTNRPAWFKMFAHQKPLIDSVPDETVGKALKAALRYFDDQDEINDLDPLALAVYSAIKPYIDEAFADFQRVSEKNRINVNRRWTPTVTTGTSGIQSLPLDTKNTEAETEAEAEADTDTEEGIRDNEKRGKGLTSQSTHPENQVDAAFEAKRRAMLDALLGTGVNTDEL